MMQARDSGGGARAAGLYWARGAPSMGSITPAVYAIPPLMGVAAYLALHNFWIWLPGSRKPHPP